MTEQDRDLGEYVRELELSLRAVVKEKYQVEYRNTWLDELRRVIGDDPFAAADATMRQRRAYSTDDFLHFTQLRDLYTAISQNWNLFQDVFSTKRTHFNSKMNEVLRGRTEEAHNRPAHLFNPIQRKRAEVAAHDVLESLQYHASPGSAARHIYFPYIRATQYLLTEEVKELAEVAERLFPEVEPRVEAILSVDGFANLVAKAGFVITIGRVAEDFHRGKNFANLMFQASWGLAALPEDASVEASSMVLVTRDRRVVATPPAFELLEKQLRNLQVFAASGAPPRLFGDPK